MSGDTIFESNDVGSQFYKHLLCEEIISEAKKITDMGYGFIGFSCKAFTNSERAMLAYWDHMKGRNKDGEY